MSQAQIGNLQVALGINTAQFAAGIAQAQGSLATFGQSLKAFAAAAAGALSFAAITTAVQSTIDRMDELGKAAQKIGIPVDELSKLEYAGRLADVSLDSLTTTMAKFSKSIADVAAGGENDAGAALTAIGVSATDAQGKLRPTGDIIADVAEQFSMMEDGAGKTAIAIALFGKSGADMIPLLNGGRDAIAEAGAELERFGGVVTPEAAKQAEDFNDNITRLQTAVAGLTQEIVAPLLPILVNLTEVLLDLASNSNTAGEASSNLGEILKQTAIFGLNLYETFYALSQIVGVFQENLANPTTLDQAAARWESAFERIRIQAEQTEEAIAKIKNPGVSASQSDVNAMFNSIDGTSGKKAAPALPPSTNSKTAKVSVPKIPKDSIDDIYGYGEAFSTLWERMEEGMPTTTALTESFQNMADTIADSLSTALVGLVSGTMSVQDAFESMLTSISQMLEELAAQIIKSQIFNLLSMLGGSFGGVTVGGMSFGGFYADGGHLGSGQWGIAGENGPEIIHGPANITPMDGMGGGSQMNVTVINNSSAQIATRQGSNGNLEVIVEEIMADKALRGGNKFDAAMQRGYGLRRAGR